jgi:hypothetical protein
MAPPVPDLPSASLYGRDDEVTHIAADRSPVLIITGDSGVGKSELLRAAQAATQGSIAPPPVTMKQGSGATQAALLDALAAAAAELAVERGLVQELGERLRTAATNLAKDRGRRVFAVIGQEILNLAKGQLGDQVGQATWDLGKEMVSAGDEQLLARIRAERDPTVTEALLAFAGELIAVGGEDVDIVLALDAVEKLSDDERGVLANVIDELPGGLRLRLGFATYRPAQQAALDELLATGGNVGHTEVRGLSEQAIEEWLRDRGLDPGTAAEVHRLTDGYPFYVADVVNHLQGGGSLDEIPHPTSEEAVQFLRRTRQAWNELDEPARVAARRLATLPGPQPVEVLQKLTGTDAAQWGDLVERLQRARIFTTTVNGQPWFHELRQTQMVRNLTVEELEESTSFAARVVAGFTERQALPGGGTQVAALLQQSATTGAEPLARLVLALAPAELAVAAAALELGDPKGVLPVDGGDVCRHAREFFPVAGDLPDALSSLAQKRLVEVSATEGDRRVDVWVTRDEVARAAVQGRALEEFGRLPLPGLFRAVFRDVLQAQLGSYRSAVYGAGPGTFSHFAELAHHLGQVPADGSFLGRGQGFFLFFRAEVGGRPTSGAVQYASAEERDAALRRLGELPPQPFGDDEVAVTLLAAHPGETIPAERFRNAAARLGFEIRGSGLDELQAPTTGDLSAADHELLKAKTFSVVRELCSEREREVLDLSRALSLHWYYEDGFLVEGEVLGASEGAVQHDTLPPIGQGAFEFFRIERAFGIGEGERLVHTQMRMGQPLTDDPIVEAVGRVRARAVRWNQRQAPRKVPIAIEQLEQLVLEAQDRELADATAFAAALDGVGGRAIAAPPPRTTVVLLRRVPEAERTLGVYDARWLSCPSASGQEEVRIELVDEFPTGSPFKDGVERIPEAFGADCASLEGARSGWSDASSLIARLLGHRMSDITLVDEEGRPADGW